MLHSLLTLLSGVLVAPIGSIVCVLLVYQILRLLKRSEDQGRRGLLAGVLGIIPGGIVGFLIGLSLAGTDPANPQAWIAHLGAAILDSLTIGTLGWIVGTHRAEALRIAGTARERSNWSLLFVALPIALTNTVGLFLALHVVAR